jgi:hypothetical protein
MNRNEDAGCKKRLANQVRRLRNLSLDAIDPVSVDPSLVDKQYPPSAISETYGERIERVLGNAYDYYIEAHVEMRQKQGDAANAEDIRVV